MAPHRPTMIVIAGPNGSGKTTLTRALLEHEWLRGCTYINADDIAERELDGWNSVEAVRAAARLADERREQCLARRGDFAYETVFSTEARISFIERAKSAGYFVRLYFVGTSDPAINKRRIEQRVALGGHDVPAEKVAARYHRSIANLSQALPIVDRAYVFDNSRENVAPVRWVRLRDGRVVKLAAGNMPGWIAAIVQALPGETAR